MDFIYEWFVIVEVFVIYCDDVDFYCFFNRMVNYLSIFYLSYVLLVIWFKHMKILLS